MAEAPEQAIPDAAMKKAGAIVADALPYWAVLTMAEVNEAAIVVARALLAAELRGREQQKEADAARILSQRYVPEDMRRQLATAIRQ